MTDNTLILTQVPRALAALGAHTTYRRLWNGVVNGRIPAEKVGKYWLIREADLPAIAKTFTEA